MRALYERRMMREAIRRIRELFDLHYMLPPGG